MREAMYVVLSGPATSGEESTSDGHHSAAAESTTFTVDHLKQAAVTDLLAAIGRSPLKALLQPFFVQALVFQSGMRAKLLCGGCLRLPIE